jgi:hypothetical protein
MRRAFARAVLAWSSLARVRRIATVGTVHVCEIDVLKILIERPAAT